MTDKELLDLLQADPEKGLAAVVQRYSAYVMKIVYTKLRDVCSKEDMEEAVSDIFFLFFRSGQRNGFQFTSLRAFLSVTAARYCISVFRKQCRHAETISLDEIAEQVSMKPAAEHTELQEALRQLDSLDRNLIMRRYFFGQKSKEIAMELHMKPNTVDKRISRALVKLKQLMEEDA